ncbi:MAG: protein-methionine-sulfoxide reductase catalytic subunit MsrP [Chloroflexi bacterium]|nr:protein-methionine-sulfoxide reductase catalytic subunit MsrP [Chloroflexota bacterium]
MSNPYKSVPIRSYEITPKDVYFSRRDFIKTAGVIAGSVALAACAPQAVEFTDEPASTSGVLKTDELGDPANSLKDITNYNNYYEFTTDKESVASLSKKFTTSPWTIEVSGMVSKPRTFGIEDLLSLFPQEERIYRLRCVEAWSMVIPWNGFPLASLLKQVEPTSDAKYVRFETVYRPEEMKGQSSPFYPWPYQEGLRLDEAMNDLTLLATGIYGETIMPQNGAPIRLVVPWKYGFKSIKSIVKIELTDKMPDTLWASVAPNEYGFYANVNPDVNHPRWSQASERRIGELSRRPSLMFNGYGEQVASLYAGMDLSLNY